MMQHHQVASPFAEVAAKLQPKDGKEQQQQPKVTVHAIAGHLSSRAHSLPAHASTRERTAHSSHHRRPSVHPSTSHASQFTQHIELYRGSVSTVYRAVDEATGTRVILKCYHKNKMQEKHYHKLDREIMAMQALRGPYVAELFGWFQDTEAIWLVMEWCEGGDLFKCMMLHGGKLDEFYVCTEIVAPLLRVLEKSHCQNLMHRDIKPENIFLTKGNRLRLGDFGLAVNWTQELPFSRSGTLDYMAPEVLRNPATTMQESTRVQMASLDQRSIKPYTEKVDVWAVGILAYELVMGKPPFEVEDETQTASLIMYSNHIKFPGEHSPLWADFVRSVLIKDPALRPSAAQAMQHPWIQHHVQTAILKAAAQGRVSSKKVLLEPLPLPTHPLVAVNTLATAAGPMPMQVAAATPPRKPAVAAAEQQLPVTPTPTPASLEPPRSTPKAQPSGLPPTSPLPRTPQPAAHPHYHHHLAHSYTQPLRAGVFNASGSPCATSSDASMLPPYSPTVDRSSRTETSVPSQPSGSSGGGSSITTTFSSTSSSTFEAVAAALAAAAGETAPAGAAALTPPAPATVHPQWLTRVASATSVRVASPLSRSVNVAAFDPLSDAAASVTSPRAHACVAVVRNSPTSKPNTGTPAPAAVERSKPRIAVPHLNKHLASIRLPSEDAMNAGVLASPGPGALPSPAPTAGQKNRSLMHLKNQAWA